MGKTYVKELAALAETYEWARTVSVDPLRQFINEAHGLPLLAIGSGGSMTAAHLAALLHRTYNRSFARHATPLELILNEPNLSDAAILLLSASGRNRDVLDAFDTSIRSEARSIATVCTQVTSPLATKARIFKRVHVLEVDSPCGRDGFLATNSLVATCTLIMRAYGAPFPSSILPATAPEISQKIRGRHAALVLHGGWSSPVATDLESKLNESAIASAQICDYRNFGHGRHLWLARRPLETFIISLINPETEKIAARTTSLIPSEIPVVELRTVEKGAAGTLDLLLQGIRLVGSLGKLQKFDPGRPSVPIFGRKLYRLSAPLPPTGVSPPVARKMRSISNIGKADATTLASALTDFVARLQETKLGGLVLDYDGTMCDSAGRFGELREDIASEVQRLIKGGITVGIATGRGRSVRELLQRALPKRLWDKVTVGYYNGGEIASLRREDAPSREARPRSPLNVAYKLLLGDYLLTSSASLTARRAQITIEPQSPLTTAGLVSHVMTLLAPLEKMALRVSASSHSIDVVPLGVGKLAVVHAVERSLLRSGGVLCIGDRGAWPGNDSGLLSHWPSLSVDETSASLSTCWNIGPAGMRGADMTLRYLRALRVSRGQASFNAHNLWESI